IIAHIGPNGAGQTPLLRVVAGFDSATGGHARLKDHDLSARRPNKPAWVGVRRTFQTARQFHNEPGLDIVEAAWHPHRKSSSTCAATWAPRSCSSSTTCR